MIFEKLLLPDMMPEHYYDVTPETVLSLGCRGLICDIDNTLVTYDDLTPTDGVLKWFECMQASGIKISFVSNNSRERVETFNRDLGFPAYGKAGKPSVKHLVAACRDMGIDKSEALLLGDQLLTDCAAAKRFGIKAVIVPPIKDKTTLFFKLKRHIEKPYAAEFARRWGK